MSSQANPPAGPLTGAQGSGAPQASVSEGQVAVPRVRQELIITALAAAMVLLVYVWLVSVGTWTQWPSRWDMYDHLARAFSHGQLALEDRPNPALLALPDPYDPAARTGVPYLQDASLYQGRYYLYFGPVPALLLLLAKSFILGPIGDQYLVFLFVCGSFLVQMLMLIGIRRRFFPKASPWTLAPLLLAAGLTNPWPWVLSTPSIYNAAITGGEFFFLAGLFAAWGAFRSEGISAWRLAMAALLWTGALGSRITQSLPVGFMAVFILAGILWMHRRGLLASKSLVPALAFAAVLGVGLAGLGWYNWARFGSIFETGVTYQLAGVPLREYGNSIYSPSYVVQNLYNYWLNLPRLKYPFPYFIPAQGLTWSVLSWIALPDIYRAQEMTGLLYTGPFLVLGLLPVITLWRQAPSPDIRGDHGRSLRSLVPGLAGSFLFGAAFFLSFFWAAERYLVDFLPCLFLLSGIGVWQLEPYIGRRPLGRGIFWISLLILIAASILISLLLSISFNADGFRQLNPVLWRQLGNLFRP